MGNGHDPRRIPIVCATCLIGIIVLSTGCPSTTYVPANRKPGASVSVQPLEKPGLHNLFHVSEHIFSGSSPENESSFASLQQLGIKTILSVDGAKPDVDAATRHGMEYVHLPFSYDGVPRHRVLALAKLAEVRPGPIYVHCHHGLHRGPVAVAVMLLSTESGWDVEATELWLQKAGTSPQYPGLIHMPRNLQPPTPKELASVSSEFPSIALDNDLAGLMVEVDARWDRLKLVKAANWAVPDKHPDIDPPHEALQLKEHYREAGRLDAVKKRGAELTRLFSEAEQAAEQLESELRGIPVDPVSTGAAFQLVAGHCAACHNRYRDVPKAP